MNLELKIPPPVVAVAAAFVMYKLSQHTVSYQISFSEQYAVSMVLVATGFLVDFLALFAFMKLKTTINPLRPENSSTLVNTGIYRYTRNPMYVGNLLFLLAWGVWLGSPTGVVGLVLYVGYITRYQIRPEERILSGLFKDEYIEYKKEVRRWV